MISPRLRVRPVDTPRVSVAIVTWGRADLALDAIRSLIAHTKPCFDLTIVDNASPDDTVSRLRQAVHGAAIIENDLNLGFGAGMNRAALGSRSDYLVLLNSDIILEPGWLEPLLAALDDDPELAAVSPILLDLDGTVQEAGSTIGPDALTVGIAAINDDDRTVAFQRRVPFASAACLVVRRAAFERAGGFDVVFGMGYYEDVELAFDLEAMGLRVAIVPASRVRHVRNGSTSPEVARRLSERNQRIFLGRWEDRLRLLPSVARAHAIRPQLTARDVLAADRILIVTDQTSRPSLGALAAAIADGWRDARITLLELRDHDTVDSPCTDFVERAGCHPDDVAVWFRSRYGHYSAVVVIDDAPTANLVLVARAQYQPQAMTVIAHDAAAPSPAMGVLWRRADVMLLLGETEDRRHLTLPAETVTVSVALSSVGSPAARTRELVPLMAQLGAAPPRR